MPRSAARLTLVASLTCALLSACAGGEDPPGTTVDAADDGSTGRGHSGVGIDTDVPDTDDDTGAPDVGVDTDDVGGGGDGGEPDAADAGGDGGAGACGDGALDEGEACDDGGQEAGDGCSATCELEQGFACEGTPSACTATSPEVEAPPEPGASPSATCAVEGRPGSPSIGQLLLLLAALGRRRRR